MKIPSLIDNGRWELFEDLTRKCRSTQSERRDAYRRFRNYYMYGADSGDGAPNRFNKIYPHIDMLTSFLYSSETTRFSTSLGVSVSDMEMAKLNPINRAINDEWSNSNTDILFDNALKLALVCGSAFIKPRWRVNGVEPFIVDPHSFGVLREDSPQMATQEAFTHSYYITESQLRRELKAAGHPRAEAILKECIAGPKQNTSALSPLDRIVTSATMPNVIGNAPVDFSVTQRYVPKVSEGLIEMTELYVFDDDIEDFRVVTIADPYVCVFDRPLEGMFLKNEAPFIQICPIPSYDYFWGYSEVERLIPLQEIYNNRYEEIRHLQALQARPPRSFVGFTGITDEIGEAFDTPDGSVIGDMPGAKVENMAPSIARDLYEDLDRISAQFEDMSGINNVMSGKGEAGVRSSGHASQLARLGSSRVKKRAMIVEDSLEKLATIYLKMKQRFDTRRMKEEVKEGGVQFSFAQFTKDFMVKVDGHSNSPIFVEDQTQLAMELIKIGAITKERLLELVSVPMRQQLLNDLKTKIEPAEQAKAAAEQKLEEERIASKGSPRHGPSLRRA